MVRQKERDRKSDRQIIRQKERHTERGNREENDMIGSYQSFLQISNEDKKEQKKIERMPLERERERERECQSDRHIDGQTNRLINLEKNSQTLGKRD